MQIDGLPSPGNPTGPAQPAQSVQRQHPQASRTGQRFDTAAPQAAGHLQHARSPEVLRLAQKLHRIPEVREHKVAMAAERLAAGYYLTKQAAEETAGRLMS